MNTQTIRRVFGNQRYYAVVLGTFGIRIVRHSILTRLILVTTLSIAGLVSGSTCTAQQIGVSSPFTTGRDSFYERMGVSFGFSFPGGHGPGSRIVGLTPGGRFTQNGTINFNQGGSRSSIPPFGGYDPGANARTGFGLVTPGGGGFSLGLDFGQGSTRSTTSTTPFTMVQNGYGGSITSGAFRPFVTGIIPVTNNGGFAPSRLDNAVTRAINSRANLTSPNYDRIDNSPRTSSDFGKIGSSATSGDISVAAIKAQRKRLEAAREAEFNTLLENVRHAEEREDYRVARIELRKAIRKCTSRSQKTKLETHLADIRRR